MKHGIKSLAAILAASVAFTAIADDDDKTLTIGDKAPAIDIEHWVKGTPIKSFEKDHIYVVEFWATWCGPCRASMPHISGLQKEYKEYDVTFVSVSDEELPVVVDFLCGRGSYGEEKDWYGEMGYTVTTDPDRSVYTDYMKAAGQRGIPTAFVVGRTGQIEYIGHPMGLDDPLAAIVDKSWDRETFKAKFEKEAKNERIMAKYQQVLREAQEQGDVDKALEAVDNIMSLDDNYKSWGANLKFQVLIASDRFAEGYSYGEKIVKSEWDNSMSLNGIAWFVVDNPTVKNRDLKFALRVAKRASELTNDADPAILDTYARCFYEMGDLANAIKWQQKAVDSMKDGQPMGGVAEALEKYKKEAGNNN